MMAHKANVVRVLGILFSAALVPACGGGGDGSASAPSGPPPILSDDFSGTFPTPNWNINQTGGAATKDAVEGSPAPSAHMTSTGLGATYRLVSVPVFNTRPSFS